jgi:hypothetical protein
MAEGLVSQIIVSHEAQTQILDIAEYEVVYAYEFIINGDRKMFVLTRQEGQDDTFKAAYHFLTYIWIGDGFSKYESGWSVVCHDWEYQHIPNANELVSSQFFGPDFFDFVINSDNYELRIVYDGYKQLMEIDPAMYM